MKYLRIKLSLIFLSIFILCGFADCSFVSRQYTYELSQCPKKEWEAPTKVKNDKYTLKKLEQKDFENFECPNLNLYEVFYTEKNISKSFKSYTGIKKNQDRCYLTMTMQLIGPPSSDEDSIENLKKWNEEIAQLADLLLEDSSVKLIRDDSRKKLVSSQQEFERWCISF